MEWIKTAITVIQILSGLGVIGLVLLQQGKGADMGAAFGSGSAGSVFGARGSANFLSRTTAIFATIFFITTLSITVLHSKSEVSKGVLGKQPTSAPAQSSTPPVPDKSPVIPK